MKKKLLGILLTTTMLLGSSINSFAAMETSGSDTVPVEATVTSTYKVTLPAVISLSEGVYDFGVDGGEVSVLEGSADVKTSFNITDENFVYIIPCSYDSSTGRYTYPNYNEALKIDTIAIREKANHDISESVGWGTTDIFKKDEDGQIKDYENYSNTFFCSERIIFGNYGLDYADIVDYLNNTTNNHLKSLKTNAHTVGGYFTKRTTARDELCTSKVKFICFNVDVVTSGGDKKVKDKGWDAGSYGTEITFVFGLEDINS